MEPGVKPGAGARHPGTASARRMPLRRAALGVAACLWPRRPGHRGGSGTTPRPVPAGGPRPGTGAGTADGRRARIDRQPRALGCGLPFLMQHAPSQRCMLAREPSRIVETLAQLQRAPRVHALQALPVTLHRTPQPQFLLLELRPGASAHG